MNKFNLLIDANNLIHRTYWQATQNGKDKNNITPLHILFTLRAIYHYASLYDPETIWVCWDERKIYKPTFRQELLPEYKGTRNKEYNNDVYSNNNELKIAFKHLGIRNFYPLQMEADDAIAFLSKKLQGKKVIISVDKDLLQLVNEDVIFFSAITKKEITIDNFEKECGVKPVQFLLYKCLLGDKSDNVPGVNGMGPVKIKKYFEGDLKLTEEALKIVEFNKNILDLDKCFKDSAEIAHYEEQFTQEPQLNWNEFLNFCEKYELNSILKQKDSWYNMFFMKIKLKSLFS